MMDWDDDVDMTDDWMNPQPSNGWVASKSEDKMEYLIERQRRRICFGYPGSIVEWVYWDKFDTPEERDAELKRLQKGHPMWHLRARDRNPMLERLGIFGEH